MIPSASTMPHPARRLAAYTKHDNIVLASAFSPDGSLVATGGGDNQEIHVWDPKTGETKAVLKGTGRPGWAVGFAADGRGIAWGNATASDNPIDRGPLEIALRLPGADAALAQPEPAREARKAGCRAKASFGALSLAAPQGRRLRL